MLAAAATEPVLTIIVKDSLGSGIGQNGLPSADTSANTYFMPFAVLRAIVPAFL